MCGDVVKWKRAHIFWLVILTGFQNLLGFLATNCTNYHELNLLDLLNLREKNSHWLKGLEWFLFATNCTNFHKLKSAWSAKSAWKNSHWLKGLEWFLFATNYTNFHKLKSAESAWEKKG